MSKVNIFKLWIFFTFNGYPGRIRTSNERIKISSVAITLPGNFANLILNTDPPEQVFRAGKRKLQGFSAMPGKTIYKKVLICVHLCKSTSYYFS